MGQPIYYLFLCLWTFMKDNVIRVRIGLFNRFLPKLFMMLITRHGSKSFALFTSSHDQPGKTRQLSIYSCEKHGWATRNTPEEIYGEPKTYMTLLCRDG